MVAALLKISSHAKDVTVKVFRTVYFVAKMCRPFTDHEKLIELQTLNGVEMGLILHSRNTAREVITHIADQMRKRIVEELVKSETKIAILVDEATTTSKKSGLVICLKAAIAGGPPIFLFLSLVELDGQSAEDIEMVILKTLKVSGFPDTYLQSHWVEFACDGASVMFGRNSGVAVRLTVKYPRLFVWHCLNHRLELAVADSVKTQNAVNHFQIFMDTIYALYSQSSKNSRELREVAAELESQVATIGRILGVRWVASSV